MLGERHVGAVIGSKTYVHKYVNDQLNGWPEVVLELSQIAVDEP